MLAVEVSDVGRFLQIAQQQHPDLPADRGAIMDPKTLSSLVMRC